MSSWVGKLVEEMLLVSRSKIKKITFTTNDNESWNMIRQKVYLDTLI